MLIFLLVFLLISNAVTIRRDKSILFSRIVIKSLLLTKFLGCNNLYLSEGLFNILTLTQLSTIVITITAISYYFF